MLANYIGGEWAAASDGGVYEKRNPARPSEVVGEFPASGEADVAAAVAAAQGACADWAARPAAERAAVLRRAAVLLERRADEMARDMTREMGKPLRESRGEAARTAAIFEYFAGEAWRPHGEVYEQTLGKSVYTVRRPLGVVALITPWNFPAAIPAWKTAPALAYGNTVVIKLAQEAPLSGLHLAACLDEAGVPPGVFNLLIGPGAQVGRPLVEHPAVAAISFTGSVEVGTQVRDRATALGKRVQLELGGNNPLIVMADADIDAAVEASFAGAFFSAGQKCTATRRIFVEAPAYEAFRDRLLRRIADGRVGDPADPEVEVGPVIHQQAMDAILAAVAQAQAEGGTLLAGGRRADSEGFLLEPTLFEGVRDDAMLSCEEVFGPVSSLYSFETLQEAIERANAVPFGLCASIFTRNVASAQRFAQGVRAGILHVNQQTAGAEIHVPFGGIKASGFGPHEQGRAAREFYTDVVTIYEDA
jgi:alpha-ketoglutaric semialdehyde dehydrogenase